MSIAKVNGMNLEICLVSLVENLSDEDRDEVAKFLSFHKHLHEGLIQSLVEGGAWEHEWWHGDVAGLREKLLPLMKGIWKELVLDLITERDQAVLERKRWDKWAWQLYHFKNSSRENFPYEADRFEVNYRGAKEAMAEMQKLLEAAEKSGDHVTEEKGE